MKSPTGFHLLHLLGESGCIFGVTIVISNTLSDNYGSRRVSVDRFSLRNLRLLCLRSDSLLSHHYQAPQEKVSFPGPPLKLSFPGPPLKLSSPESP